MKIKRNAICIILCVALVMSILYIITSASSDIKVQIDDNILNFEHPPIIKNGIIHVPIVYISQCIGATVDIDLDTWFSTWTMSFFCDVDGVRQYSTITLDSPVLILNGEQIIMEAAPKRVGTGIYAPVSMLGIAFGADAVLSDDSMTLVITSNRKLVGIPEPAPMRTPMPALGGGGFLPPAPPVDAPVNISETSN